MHVVDLDIQIIFILEKLHVVLLVEVLVLALGDEGVFADDLLVHHVLLELEKLLGRGDVGLVQGVPKHKKYLYYK